MQCDACDLALDVFKQMHEDRIRPNVVTYNTLVDVYGKTGQWEKAVRVLDDMRDEVSGLRSGLQGGGHWDTPCLGWCYCWAKLAGCMVLLCFGCPGLVCVSCALQWCEQEAGGGCLCVC